MCWCFIEDAVRVTVRVSWEQSEDNVEMFAVAGVSCFLHLCHVAQYPGVSPFGGQSLAAPREWDILERELSLQLQVVLQLALTFSVHLLQDKSES